MPQRTLAAAAALLLGACGSAPAPHGLSDTPLPVVRIRPACDAPAAPLDVAGASRRPGGGDVMLMVRATTRSIMPSLPPAFSVVPQGRGRPSRFPPPATADGLILAESAGPPLLEAYP